MKICTLLMFVSFHFQQSKIGSEGDSITGNMQISDKSLFGHILKRIATFVDKPLWKGDPPKNGVMNVDGCSEFHRLWSAMQFLFCIPLKSTEYTTE